MHTNLLLYSKLVGMHTLAKAFRIIIEIFFLGYSAPLMKKENLDKMYYKTLSNAD